MSRRRILATASEFLKLCVIFALFAVIGALLGSPL